jgi:hypothetical protein
MFTIYNKDFVFLMAHVCKQTPGFSRNGFTSFHLAAISALQGSPRYQLSSQTLGQKMGFSTCANHVAQGLKK